jgi:hypothetical protein
MTASKTFLNLFAVALSCATFASPVVATDFDQSQAIFDSVLKQYVKNARVDYAALEAPPQDVNRYLIQVAAVSKAEFKKWSEPQQLLTALQPYWPGKVVTTEGLKIRYTDYDCSLNENGK